MLYIHLVYFNREIYICSINSTIIKLLYIPSMVISYMIKLHMYLNLMNTLINFLEPNFLEPNFPSSSVDFSVLQVQYARQCVQEDGFRVWRYKIMIIAVVGGRGYSTLHDPIYACIKSN